MRAGQARPTMDATTQAGQYYYGPGDHSMDGTSEESRFVLNPYILVYPDFASMLNCVNHTKLTEGDLDEASFPMVCPPTSLTWHPKVPSAEVRMDMTGFHEALNARALRTVVLSNYVMLLAALNARDFGFDYLSVDLDGSDNITQDEVSSTATEILYYIHTGSSCGHDGGCNNGSPFQQELSYLRITALPATLVLKLWRTAPADAAAAPDFSFTIVFE